MAKSSNDKRIDYVEFNVGDIARSRGFHGKAFGWSFRDSAAGLVPVENDPEGT
jgi:uncharacterized protein